MNLIVSVPEFTYLLYVELSHGILEKSQQTIFWNIIIFFFLNFISLRQKAVTFHTNCLLKAYLLKPKYKKNIINVSAAVFRSKNSSVYGYLVT